MRSYSRKRKNNIIIGTLCGVMLLMVVGYAAFASQLNIKGTSGISSNWDIEITNIRGGNPDGGDAYDISEPTYTPTTATFNTGLKTPVDWNSSGLAHGSDRYYEVEVTNKGTLTGLVTIANLSCGDNDAISCSAYATNGKDYDENWNEDFQETYNPFEQGQQDYSDIAFTLAPGEKHYIYVAVYYEDVTSQPENLSASINLELTYEQDGADSGSITPYTGTLYSYEISNMIDNSTRIYVGDNANKIRQYGTEDYSTLNNNFFLKHNITDNLVQSNEVCFIKEGLHCLNPSTTEYENNKNILLNLFSEEECHIFDESMSCDDGTLRASIDLTDKYAHAGTNDFYCTAYDGDYAYCSIVESA